MRILSECVKRVNPRRLAARHELRYRGLQGYLYAYCIPGTDTNTQHTFYTGAQNL